MKPGETIDVTVTFLEMLEPVTEPPPACAGVAVKHVRAPDAGYYRELYGRVGGDWHWVERKMLGDAELAAIIQDPAVEVHVLTVDGAEAGYAELDRRTPGEVRLMYFGLTPEFIGRGLGRWFLHWAVHCAWSYGPRRVWVDTCSLDHPRALGNYEAVGFRAFRRIVKPFTVPRGQG